MFMPHLGAPELIIVLVIILLVFGVGKLPQVGGALGKGLSAFKKGQSGEEVEEEEEEKPKRKTTRRATKKAE